MLANQNIMYIAHGGGPMPLLGDPSHKELNSQLINMACSIKKPSAILVVSAHWEANKATITSAAHPPLLYDYSGFPEAAYSLTYPAPGEPALAKIIFDALQKAGIDAELDENRGFDHGVFVPLTLMYPKADIPVVQLSLLKTLDAQQHLKMGEALQRLPWKDLLIVGSGFSFHNMQAFFNPALDPDSQKNIAFDEWLIESVQHINTNTGQARLANWDQAPHARFCHPREEHLLPLHVCYGIAGRASSQHTSVSVLNTRASMFQW
ncbi:class III extradiol ring-cleavage dioxygenase [Reinekea marina]|uniref:DODA-type extradiol aromatic ring-opening family dioxygenase n=1 Tax=Reinekea marina TaxID=1310421 RepID=A0ABV7WNM3_9GAMM|nr:class III extradiol ring-cleavage dioxygenase [Reinekea marina]MDN3650737.1 class III extradiol ring-cleavage dioxygenase [Reinekea marina]